uniref:Uncharacterized protein n=1 Tax=Cryptomonas curvata TaxID=233186 RepID=A0A7S0QX56_9CRYP|mmetsp:Transcript_56454/g.118062  ORF Transcript_56454/g.118062 Transcript_56454/m.118062 type:complete len:135 (+) Transcript_56454:120-524(+)
MFADLHHLHQFVSLEQGGSVTAASWVGGTGAGEANIYFGATHITADNVHESWLSDDQVSDMNAGVNGPIDRNEGAYNGYAAVKAFWADTTNMDNLRGGDATGLATPGAQEVTSDADGVSGFGNTVHSYSGDSFY